MTAGVIALPQSAEGVLAPDVPDLEVHVGKGDSRDILTDRRDGLHFGRWVRGEEDGLDLFVECGFAGVVEAE